MQSAAMKIDSANKFANESCQQNLIKLPEVHNTVIYLHKSFHLPYYPYKFFRLWLQNQLGG